MLPYFCSTRSHCLDDGPAGNSLLSLALPPKFRNRLPGTILGGDEQCATHYGEGWTRHETVCSLKPFIDKDLW